MGPKKAAAEVRSPPSTGAEDQLMKDQKADSPVEGAKAVRKVSPHPTTMEMVKEALMELDQRKGVSAQAIRTFIKEKYTTVDETRLKTMVRKALVKGIDSGVFVRPANSATTTGAQGRFRLAVRKPAKSKEAKENANPNVSKAKESKSKTGDVKTKKTKSAAVEGDKPKKTKKNEVSASKVAPAKKPKAKRTAGETGEGESEPKTFVKKSKASKGQSGEKSGAKKAAQKAEGEVSPASEGALTEVQEGGKEAVAPVQKRGGKKVGQKAEDGEQTGTKSLGRKGKKAAEK